MQIDYTKVFGNNYNSLGEFELDIVPGRHLVIGENLDSKNGNSNGSGKSSLLESVIWTQYKKSVRGNDPSRDAKGECMTGYECKIGDQEYRIERYQKHKKFGTCSRIILNGEEISHRLSSATDDEILKLIPIPYDLFVSTSVVLQGIPINFTQFTPAVRKTIIEDALGFHVWDKIRDKFKSKIVEVEEAKNAVEAKFKECETLMTDLNARIESAVDETSNRKVEIETKAKSLKLEINSIKKRHDEYQAALIDSLNGKAKLDIQAQVTNVRSTLTTFKNKLVDLKTIIEEELCPTCGTPYPEAKMKDAKAEFESINKKLPKLNETVAELEKTVEKVNKIQSDIRNEENLMSSKKRDLSGVLSDMAKQAEPENDKVAGLREKLDGAVAAVNTLNEELGEHTKRLEGFEYIDSLLLPSSPFRTKVLEKYLVHITGIIDVVAPLVFPDVEIQLAINNKATGIDLLITRKGRVIEYKSLSGGEKRRLDIVIILAFQRFLIEASGVTTNLVVLDEIFDALDSRGVESVVNCIDTLFPDTHAVYVISHNSELKSQFDSIVKVEKRGGMSRLV